MRFLTSLAVLVGVVSAASTAAQTTQPGFEPKVDAALISEALSVEPGDQLTLGLVQKIDDGWHTYWKNPGDSGEPTSITWTLPDGVTASEIIWPHPERIPYYDLLNYGYEGEAVLLTEVRVPDDWPAGTPLNISAEAFWLVCEDICIPEEADFALSVPTSAGPTTLDPDHRTLFDDARARNPVPSPWPANAQTSETSLKLAVAGNFDTGTLTDAYFFPTGWGVTNHAAPQEYEITYSALTLTLQKGDLPPTENLDGLLVLSEEIDGGTVARAFEISAEINQAAPLAAATTADLGVLQAVILAILGGMILNLMPCVFPILSLKALGLVQHAPTDLRQARMHGLSYSGGILLSFLILASVLLILRAGGAQLGWGFQLQSPLILALLAYVLLAVGLNLSGTFEFGSRFAGIGGRFAGQSGHFGSFSTGVLAVIVATPCTAPFMGTALGFAMFQPAPVTLAVFLALGIGFALPYLLLSFMPALGRILPKPGPWMVRLKEFLAFPIYATIAWLLWVLSRQLNADAFLSVLIGGVLVAFAAWLFGTLGQVTARPGRLVASVFAVAALLGASLLLPLNPSANATTAGTMPVDSDLYEEFTPDRLEELRAEGRPVFINLTAAWCITCEVNDRVVLSRDAVVDAMEAQDIAYLKGDWTNRDADITALLESYGRNGVPLYLVYPKGAGEAQMLPQILTERLVLEAFNGVDAS